METTNAETAVNFEEGQTSKTEETIVPQSQSQRKKSVYVKNLTVGKEAIKVNSAMATNHQKVTKVKVFEPLDAVRKKSLYVGNLDSSVNEELLYTMFSNFARVVHVKIHRGETSTYAFVQFQSEDIAQAAMNVMDGGTCCGRQMRVRWSGRSPSPQPDWEEGLSLYFNVYVNNLDIVTSPQALHTSMSVYGDVVDVKVLPVTPSSKSLAYAFVYYRYKADAEHVINQVRQMWIDNRMVRFAWAYAGYPHSEFETEKGNGDGGCPPTRGKEQPLSFIDVMKKCGNTTSVYIGNLPPMTSQTKLEQKFSSFGHLLSVKVLPGKLFAFAEFQTKEEAAAAIVGTNNTMFEGRWIKCFWGRDQSYNNRNGRSRVHQPSEQKFVGYGQAGVQNDPQSYNNAPLLQENQFPTDYPGYYYGGYSNDFNNSGAGIQSIQQIPYQPNGSTVYYTMPMMQQQQEVWPTPCSQNMWIPTEASGTMYNYAFGPALPPHPSYQPCWYPETPLPTPAEEYVSDGLEPGVAASVCPENYQGEDQVEQSEEDQEVGVEQSQEDQQDWPASYSENIWIPTAATGAMYNCAFGSAGPSHPSYQPCWYPETPLPAPDEEYITEVLEPGVAALSCNEDYQAEDKVEQSEDQEVDVEQIKKYQKVDEHIPEDQEVDEHRQEDPGVDVIKSQDDQQNQENFEISFEIVKFQDYGDEDFQEAGKEDASHSPHEPDEIGPEN